MKLWRRAPPDKSYKPRHTPYTKALVAAEPSGEPNAIQEGHEKILKVRDLKVTFTTKKSFFARNNTTLNAVDGLSFDLSQGETLGIVGESGSGKSTLAYAILRLVESTGTVVFMGQEIHPLNLKQLRRCAPVFRLCSKIRLAR